MWSYADISRREQQQGQKRTPGSQAESYLGRGRVVTEFEHIHFGFDNIIPGRRCTAYFSAGLFVDSKSVFDKLEELGFPREAVVCIQRRPSRNILITFVDKDTINKFISCVSIHLKYSSAVINGEDMPLVYLNIYDAPHELPDVALNIHLCLLAKIKCLIMENQSYASAATQNDQGDEQPVAFVPVDENNIQSRPLTAFLNPRGRILPSEDFEALEEAGIDTTNELCKKKFIR